MTHPGDVPFRVQVRDRLTLAFGPPLEVPVDTGIIYRWSLKRPGLHTPALHVTLDSPELPHLGHVLISDPASTAVEPIASVTVRTMEEADMLVKRIERQWRG